MSSSWQPGPPHGQPPYPGHQPPPPPQYQPYPPQPPYGGYPPQGYQQYPPPQQQYPPPPPPPPNPQAPQQSRPPRKPVKAKPLHIVLATVVVLALCGGAAYVNDLRPDPEVGKCLVDMDYDFLLGMDVVECEDPEASYEIVEFTRGHDDAICTGYSNGESYEYTGGRKNRTKWSLCAIPIG